MESFLLSPWGLLHIWFLIPIADCCSVFLYPRLLISFLGDFCHMWWIFFRNYFSFILVDEQSFIVHWLKNVYFKAILILNIYKIYHSYCSLGKLSDILDIFLMKYLYTYCSIVAQITAFFKLQNKNQPYSNKNKGTQPRCIGICLWSFLYEDSHTHTPNRKHYQTRK